MAKEEEIIMIDPGHGGKDPGGGTNQHFKEKDMVLAISYEQKKHFERNGIKVVMTRTDDEYLDSVPRTSRVKNSGAAYCISNHINAFNGKASGAETIHSIHSDGKIAEGVLKALVDLGAGYRRFFSKEGNNGLDYYYMHRMTGHVNTIIVEYGFADHAGDTEKIRKDWKKYAEAVAKYYIENVFKKTYIPEKTIEAKTTGRPAPTDNKKWRIATGLFDTAERLDREMKRFEEAYPGWLMYEYSYKKGYYPRYQIKTGTFIGKNVAEYYAEEIHQKFGWKMFVEEA